MKSWLPDHHEAKRIKRCGILNEVADGKSVFTHNKRKSTSSMRSTCKTVNAGRFSSPFWTRLVLDVKHPSVSPWLFLFSVLSEIKLRQTLNGIKRVFWKNVCYLHLYGWPFSVKLWLFQQVAAPLARVPRFTRPVTLVQSLLLFTYLRTVQKTQQPYQL